MEPLLGAAKSPGGADLIKDSDITRFMADVIDASRQVPVIVDFWAPWCGPCKQLGPLIERCVREAQGAVKLVKINIDENPEIAQQMRIQSIPAVYAFKDGRPVDGFVGAVPESQIKAFIKRLGTAKGAPPSPIQQAIDEAKEALEDGDVGTASALFGQVLAREPANVAAVAGLAKCYLAAGDTAKAKGLIAGLPADAAKSAEIAQVRSAIELADQAETAGDVGELMEKIAHDPRNYQARFDLAMALFGGGKSEAAMDQLLELFRLARAWNEDAARKQLVKFFEALGPTHALTVQGRRRLSSLMFT